MEESKLTFNTHFKNQKEYKICETHPGCINLGIVENFIEHPSEFKFPPGINFYPQENSKTRIALIEELENYIDINRNNILLINGSGRGLELILNALGTQDSTLLIPVPNYPGFTHTANMSLCKVKLVKLTFPLEYKEMNEAIKDSDIIYISNPNLPLGYVIDHQILHNWINLYEDKWFIIDEAYYEYDKYSDDSTLESYVQYVKTGYKNVIITRTFSKVFGLAGSRLGYIIANEQVISIIRTGYSTKDIPEQSIQQGLMVMKNRQLYIDKIAEFHGIREMILNTLSKIVECSKEIYGFSITKMPWFLIQANNTKYVCDYMKRFKYLVRDKSDDHFMDNTIRIAISTEPHMLDILELISVINGKVGTQLITTVIFDLDGTLRKDRISAITKEVSDMVKQLSDLCQLFIISNTPENQEDVREYLTKNGIPENIPVITPISKKMNPNREKWFVYDGWVYILEFPDTKDFYKLFTEISTCGKIRVIEKDNTINSDELGIYPNVVLPHIGAILSIIEKHYDVEIEIIGKQSRSNDMKELNLPQTAHILMVGDTKSDMKYAYRNLFLFKDVRKKPIESILQTLIRGKTPPQSISDKKSQSVVKHV